MKRVVCFEIHADDPQRAMDFYGEVFDWSFQALEDSAECWRVVTGPEDQPGIHGILLRRQGLAPEAGQAVAAWVGTVQVQSLDDAIGAVVAAGGQIVAPKMEHPNSGWSCHCRDPEGNLFGLWCQARSCS